MSGKVWGFLGVMGLVLCVWGAHIFSGKFPVHFLRVVEVESFNSNSQAGPCGTIQALESQRVPVKTGPEVWGFGRMGGLGIRVCQPGQLSFITYRKKVKNTPSRWEAFINDQFLASGLVSDQKESVEIDVKQPGIVSLIFSNAYNAKDNMKERRTLYFENVQFVEKK